jgi:hypothetical protein
LQKLVQQLFFIFSFLFFRVWKSSSSLRRYFTFEDSGWVDGHSSLILFSSKCQKTKKSNPAFKEGGGEYFCCLKIAASEKIKSYHSTNPKSKANNARVTSQRPEGKWAGACDTWMNEWKDGNGSFSAVPCYVHGAAARACIAVSDGMQKEEDATPRERTS